MTVRRYAEGTPVTVDKSRNEIEALLRKHGAHQIVSGYDSNQRSGRVLCAMGNRQVRFAVEAPPLAHYELDERGRPRKPAVVASMLAAEERRRWRALLLVIKAKLEIVAGGDREFEHEFMADILLPDGRTVAEGLSPVLADSYEHGRVPNLPLLGGGS